ncbi:MAG TPA: amidohydrolase family protein [Gemmatimonadaceae bacterium]|nr:amidohydrolase family protein [Gemmatimonadaceae bacterium]
MSMRTLALLAAFAAVTAAEAQSRPVIIRNATVVPVTAPRIERGTIILRNGRIEALGANIAIPNDGTVIDGTGLFVYPGLIDAGTNLGLTEIGSVPGGEDTREIGDFNPQNVILSGINPHSELIPVTRVDGVTTVITNAEGGLVSGAAALIDLAGWTAADMAIVPRVAMVVNFPSLGGGGFGGFGGGGGQQRPLSERREAMNRQVRQLYQFFEDAKAYADIRSRANGAAAPNVNQKFEALIPFVRGQLPVIVEASSPEQIRGAIAFADSLKLKLIIRGAQDGWQLADTLAARKIPVIVGPLTQAPANDEPYDLVYANPGVMAAAGVQLAFQSSDASNARTLPYHAALATAYGLNADEALKAITINPARIFGIADRYGSLEVGKVANVVVTTGDPLDVRTHVRHVFIRGEAIPFDDRHTTLYEKFRGRPKPKN